MKYNIEAPQQTKPLSQPKPSLVDEPRQKPKDGELCGLLLDETWMLKEPLGTGGAGVVYLAEHCRSGRPAAVKILRTQLSNEAKHQARFEKEAQILRQLQHPHIVDLYDYGHDQVAGSYFVMAYLEGADLGARVAKRTVPMTWVETVHIICQICDAMAYAHEHDVIHRDLKPENIFLVDGDEAKAKVLDFGIARIDDPEEYRITKTGIVVGTPAYISPEQATAEAVDHRADIYSLTVILHELLVGRPLFDTTNPYQTMLRHAYNIPETLSQARPGHNFPADLEALVWEGLSKDPNERPQTMAALKARLEGLLAKEHTEDNQSTPDNSIYEPTVAYMEAVPVPLLLEEVVETPQDQEFVDFGQMSTLPAPLPVDSILPPAQPFPVADATTPALTSPMHVVEGIPLRAPSEPGIAAWDEHSAPWLAEPSSDDDTPPIRGPHFHRAPTPPLSSMRTLCGASKPPKPRRNTGFAKLVTWGVFCIGIIAGMSLLMANHPFH